MLASMILTCHQLLDEYSRFSVEEREQLVLDVVLPTHTLTLSTASSCITANVIGTDAEANNDERAQSPTDGMAVESEAGGDAEQEAAYPDGDETDPEDETSDFVEEDRKVQDDYECAPAGDDD
jgi:hypothetical protein